MTPAAFSPVDLFDSAAVADQAGIIRLVVYFDVAVVLRGFGSDRGSRPRVPTAS